MAQRYGRGLRQYLALRRRNLPNVDVQDLAQEVYFRLLRVSDQEAIRNPEAYIFTVARHVLYEHSLEHAHEPPFTDITEAIPELLTPDGEEPPGKAEISERVERLEKVLKKLPPHVGATLVLHKLEGYTVQEVADQLGVARETAKKYLTRAAQLCSKTGYGRGEDE